MFVVTSYNGSTFTIQRVDRLHMGAYLCIASNGIPPTISKRVMLIVHCKYILRLLIIIAISTTLDGDGVFSIVRELLF